MDSIVRQTPETPRYLYHGTTRWPRSLKKDSDRGGIKPTAMGQVSVSSTEPYAKSYADRKGGSRGIVLRIRDNGQFVPDDKISVAGDYLTKDTIKPENIDVKMPDGSWAPLSTIDASLGIPELKATTIPEGSIKPAKKPRKRTRTIKTPPRPRPASLRGIR